MLKVGIGRKVSGMIAEPIDACFDAFCQRLSTAIKASNLSRAELAQQMGVKPSTIKSWCVGRRSPTVRRLLELSQLLDLEATDLFVPLPQEKLVRRECPACGQTFRREVGFRIHLALKAKDDAEHQRYHGSP